LIQSNLKKKKKRNRRRKEKRIEHHKKRKKRVLTIRNRRAQISFCIYISSNPITFYIKRICKNQTNISKCKEEEKKKKEAEKK
jgi:hypothetical protein